MNPVKHPNPSSPNPDDVSTHLLCDNYFQYSFQKIIHLLLFLVAPKIDRRNLHNLTVKEGEPILIDVKVSGEPAPEVTWYQDDRTVISTSHKRVDNVPYNTKLIHDHPERKDSGIYKIVAINKYGQDQAEIEITVVCKYLYANFFREI